MPAFHKYHIKIIYAQFPGDLLTFGLKQEKYFLLLKNFSLKVKLIFTKIGKFFSIITRYLI